MPVDLITQARPGEMFVHRNVANLVVPTDTNLMAVLHYAVAELKVRDVIVCGHEECGGIAPPWRRPRAAAGGALAGQRRTVVRSTPTRWRPSRPTGPRTCAWWS